MPTPTSSSDSQPPQTGVTGISEIADRVATKLSLPPDVTRTVIKSFLERLSEDVAAGRIVRLAAFGSFRLALRAARIGRNPRKPDETYLIPAKVSVTFSPGVSLRTRISDVDQSKIGRKPRSR